MQAVHELSVCQSLLDQVEAIARDHGAAAVRRVAVQIGPLSGVDSGLLARAFEIASAGTMAAGATLEVEAPPVRVECRRCNALTTASPGRLLCGACGDWHTRLVGGDEMLLARVEMTREKEGICAVSAAAT
jgi:hydrogenase nickel incorporation protein HypA/HybF